MVRRNKVVRGNKRVRTKNGLRKVLGPQLYSPREKMQDCIWIFKLGDADDKPSVPHAHAQGKGYRLDAWTGDIYPAGTERKRTIGKLKRKELAKLHSDPGFIDFTKKQIQWYRENNPHISFYIPEWFETQMKKARLVASNKESEIDTFIFEGKAYIK